VKSFDVKIILIVQRYQSTTYNSFDNDYSLTVWNKNPTYAKVIYVSNVKRQDVWSHHLKHCWLCVMSYTNAIILECKKQTCLIGYLMQTCWIAHRQLLLKKGIILCF